VTHYRCPMISSREVPATSVGPGDVVVDDDKEYKVGQVKTFWTGWTTVSTSGNGVHMIFAKRKGETIRVKE
jgi:hypothetical protein